MNTIKYAGENTLNILIKKVKELIKTNNEKHTESNINLDIETDAKTNLPQLLCNIVKLDCNRFITFDFETDHAIEEEPVFIEITNGSKENGIITCQYRDTSYNYPIYTDYNDSDLYSIGNSFIAEYKVNDDKTKLLVHVNVSTSKYRIFGAKSYNRFNLNYLLENNERNGTINYISNKGITNLITTKTTFDDLCQSKVINIERFSFIVTLIDDETKTLKCKAVDNIMNKYDITLTIIFFNNEINIISQDLAKFNLTIK